jgi:molybdopterin molybdotransferase
LENLLSVSEAIEKILADFHPLSSEQIPIEDANGRILAKDFISDVALPRFTDSSMDGFAVIAADVRYASTDTPVRLQVIADVPAGMPYDGRLENGQAVRVMTGGVLPESADAVVPVELTTIDYRHPGTIAPSEVSILKPVNPGDNVRKCGQDIHAGQLLLAAGNQLRPQDIGMLATLGNSLIEVIKRPKVGLLSTGDEIVPPGKDLPVGKIYDSNGYTLAALVDQAGGKAVRLGLAPDKSDVIKSRLEQAIASEVDLIITSAGVSVGAFDFVRSVIEEQGKITFWRVNMRPGKPLAFGNYMGIPIVGLPGNPVSAFVGFEVFIRPIIAKMRGQAEWRRPVQRVILDESITSDGRESYLRSIIFEKRGKLYARLTGHQGSGNLYSLVQANALLIVPSEVKSLPVGAELDAWIFNPA